MRLVGIAIVVAGGVAVIGSQFLSYDSISDDSLWQQTTRYPAILSALAVIAVGLSGLSLVINRWLPLALAAVISAFVFGEVFPVGASDYDVFEVGFWLLVAGAFFMTAGAVLATADSVRLELGRARRRAVAASSSDRLEPRPDHVPSERPPREVAPTAPERSRGAASAPMAASPPPGWYPDPAGTARERYWSGEGWTTDVRN
jgi:hypothetical protein